jgi:hypothetical protein
MTCSLLALVLVLCSQETPPQEQGPGAARQTATGEGAVQAQTPAAQSGTFANDQLEQLVAPIALYPDALLAQVLMASTYPLEIVEAARWSAKNPKITSDKLEAALKDQTWDPSVKSLCAFPDVLKRMNENLDWVQDLGDAFLGQKEQLMQCVQSMRRKAYDSGNLKTSKEIKVTEQADKVIVIESAQPEVIYVPTYYPTAVYGGWSYPYYYYPPMYPPAPAGGYFFSFTAGMFWGAAIWGDCDWGGNDVDIDIDNYNNFIDKTEIDARKQDLKNRASEGGRGQGQGKGKWQHSPEHRKGVGYKNNEVAQRFGGSGASNRVSRDQARGFTDRGGQRPSASTGDRGGTGSRGSASTRPSAGTRDAPSSRPSNSQRSTSSTRSQPSSGTGDRSGSFSGARSSSFDRASSSRGSASRGSMGSRGGGGRGGGGRRGR